MHACGASQAHTNAFQGLAQHAGLFGKRFLSDEDREVLMKIDVFCLKNALKHEVVDVGTMNFFAKLGLKMKGIKTPAIYAGDRRLYSISTNGDLKKLLNP